MQKSKLRNSIELLLDTIFEAMHEKKAEQILLLDLSEIKGANFDYFVIAHGNSTTQVNAIAEEIRRKVKTVCLQNPAHTEGFANSEWILLDYLNVIVHIFQQEVRAHYQLENLWADAVITPIEEEIPEKKQSTKKTISTKKETTTEKTPAPKKNTTRKTHSKEVQKTTKITKNTKQSNERKSAQSKSKSATKSKSTRSAKTKI